MSNTFILSAQIKSSNPDAIKPILENLFKSKGSVTKQETVGFTVSAVVEGSSAKELNRSLLSKLRKVEKKTTLRAEWTSKGVTERYFDYVLKKTIEE
ncbi:MAG: hypothetical protein JRN52_04340 [Nitrososphaerota archaeon]|nr:hypothetical protein [Nitrososphaerota archaeon]